MKKLFKNLTALYSAATLFACCSVLTACGSSEVSILGTYTATVVNDLGDNVFTLTLSEGNVAQMAIAAGPIGDTYTGTYTAEGYDVSIKGLSNPDNTNSTTPGLWNDVIDASTGDCEVTVNPEDYTFEFKPTGGSSLPDLEDEDSSSGDSSASGESYTCSITGDLGTDTFTLTLGDDAVATMVIASAIFSDTFTGSYVRTDNIVDITGLIGDTSIGTGVHPSLYGDYIDPETGDCQVTLNDDYTFTFTPIGDSSSGGDDTTIEWSGTAYEAVSYVENGTDEQTMDVYVPESEEAMPLLVTIHGGMFTMGSSSMMSDIYEYFRSLGFVCASLNYTLGAATYPQGVIDCKTAVQYLVDNASTYNIDSSKIIVMGESAGSTIASLVSLSGAADFKASDSDSDYTFEVNTYIDFYGPVSNGDPDIGENIDGGVTNWLGEEAAIDLSSYFTGMFPCKNIWIQHGDADTSVNVAHAELFKAAIDEYNAAQEYDIAKINTYYEILEGAGHMDDAFYTDENLGNLYGWLCDVYGIVNAELVGTYTYTVESTNSYTGEAVTDVFELNLYDDGSCTIGIPDGTDYVKGPYSGSYVLDGSTITVSGLADVPSFGYTFVVDGGFTATLDDTNNTFTPVESAE